MNVQEFRSLEETEKAVTLINNGVLVGKRVMQSYLVFLYQLDSFYVEILYNNQTNFVYRFRAFENTDLLEPYLSRIDISWVEELKY
jgi:hypothetical protein